MFDWPFLVYQGFSESLFRKYSLVRYNSGGITIRTPGSNPSSDTDIPWKALTRRLSFKPVFPFVDNHGNYYLAGTFDYWRWRGRPPPSYRPKKGMELIWSPPKTGPYYELSSLDISAFPVRQIPLFDVFTSFIWLFNCLYNSISIWKTKIAPLFYSFHSDLFQLFGSFRPRL